MDTLVETLQAKHVCYTTLELGKRIYIWFSSPVTQIGVCTYVYQPGTSSEGSVGAARPH